jgi:hypothetical protein
VAVVWALVLVSIWFVPRWLTSDGTGTIVHAFDKSQLFITLWNANMDKIMHKRTNKQIDKVFAALRHNNS